MQTLTYGLKLPDTNDKGTSVFPAMESNIQQLDAHDHDGTTSKKLTTASVDGVTQAISNAGWVLLAYGIYKQTVTLPAGLDFGKISVSIRESVSGDPLMLTIQKVSSSQYDVFINDNTLSLVAVYS